MRSRKNKVSFTLIEFGFFLIILSVSFLIYQNHRIENKKEEDIKLEKQFEQSIESENEVSQYRREKKVSSGKEIANATNAVITDVTDEIQNSAIGVIRIDKIGIVLPIFEDASTKSLMDGVGIVENTDLPSSKENTITVLAGHRGGRNEDQTFLNIDKLEKGDEIKITKNKEILYYAVIGQEIIEPTDWKKFTREENKTKLFLMSCYPYPQNYQRLLVKAKLIKNIENKDMN